MANDTDYYININGKSKHLDSQRDLNETNLGIGVTAEQNRDNIIKVLMAGTYDNSFNNQSVYGLGSIAKRFGDDYYADFGVAGGGVTGYDRKITPMAALMMNLGKKDLGRLSAMYAPPTDKTGALIMMNLGIPFR